MKINDANIASVRLACPAGERKTQSPGQSRKRGYNMKPEHSKGIV